MQVARFTLTHNKLQAAHCATREARERSFLVAAKRATCLYLYLYLWLLKSNLSRVPLNRAERNQQQEEQRQTEAAATG